MNLDLLALRAFPYWNSRPITERDALRFLRKKVLLVESDKAEVPGLFTEYEGYLFIVIHPSLRGYNRLWVLLHEIGHFLFHTPTMQCFDPRYELKADFEANMFAAVALIPFEWFETRSDSDILEDGIPRDLLAFRKNVFERYAI